MMIAVIHIRQTVEGKHRQTYLIVFIDDASRLIVHGEFFFEDNALNMQKTFQKAIGVVIFRVQEMMIAVIHIRQTVEGIPVRAVHPAVLFGSVAPLKWTEVVRMYRAYWGMEFNPFDKEIAEKQFYRNHSAPDRVF